MCPQICRNYKSCSWAGICQHSTAHTLVNGIFMCYTSEEEYMVARLRPFDTKCVCRKATRREVLETTL